MVTDNAAVTTTDYAGGYIYENSSLKFISQAEGYIEPDGAGGYAYVYQYKDHLGNIRLSYGGDAQQLTYDTFATGTDGWTASGTVTLENEAGRLKATLANKYQGIHKYLEVIPGSEIRVEGIVDKGSTSSVYVGLWEYDGSGVHIRTTGAYVSGEEFAYSVALAPLP